MNGFSEDNNDDIETNRFLTCDSLAAVGRNGNKLPISEMENFQLIHLEKRIITRNNY